MDQHLRINLSEPLLPSQDYEFLFKEGIAYAQHYAQSIWTDYNHHDPGVTILEYLCFGLTDLGYRADFPITDLLYASENQQLNFENNAFFPPEEILPSAALTLNDYRRLILDQIDGINNVWVNFAKDLHENYKGLYDVQILVKTDGNSAKYPGGLIKKVWELWMEHRNLGEDIRSIRVLEEEPIEFQFTINLDQDASAEQVLASVTHKLEHFLNPLVTYFSFDEKLAKGEDINVLLDGPKPRINGNIDMRALQEAPTPVFKSQIQDMLLKIPGVKSISAFKVFREGFHFNQEEISFPANHFLMLAESHKNWSDPDFPIQFTRNNYTIKPDPTLTGQNYRVLVANNFKYINSKINFIPPTLRHSAKNLLDIEDYYSIQRFFPGVYGLGHFGLSRDTDLTRQAQVRQLKGYLAIFETLFSSYLKQLSEIKHLYSIDFIYKKDEKPAPGSVDKKTKKVKSPPYTLDEFQNELNTNPTKNKYNYAFEFPVDIPDIEGLIDQKKLQKNEAVEKNLELLFRRCNTFLDHLLARFGERFQVDWLSKFLHSPEDVAEAKYQQLVSKFLILREYDQLSRTRGLGLNYSLRPTTAEGSAPPAWPGEYVSGFKKKLCYWLNLHDYSDRSLTDFFPFEDFDLRPPPNQTDPAPQSADSFDEIAIPFDLLLEVGHIQENFLIKEDHNGAYEVFFYTLEGQEYGPLYKKPGEFEARLWLDTFTKNIAAFNIRSKGFFVVEHILLRPLHERLYQLELSIPAEIFDPEAAKKTISDEEKIVFQTLYYTTVSELENLSNDLVAMVSNESNYMVISEGNLNLVLITRDKKPVLIREKNFQTKQDAEDFKKDTIAFFKDWLNPDPNHQIPNSKLQDNFNKSRINTIDQWVDTDLEPERKIEHQLEDKDFYKHKISIVLPDWPSIFKEDEFRAIFREIAQQHLPGHIYAQIIWLDWEAMKRFEQAYSAWWQKKSNPQTTMLEIDQLAGKLLEVMLEIPQETNQIEEKKLFFSKTYFDLVFKKENVYQLLNETDLQIIDGIDEEVEYYLKRHGIKDWGTLWKAPTEIIESLARNVDMVDFAENLVHIQSQARRAHEQQWEALQNLQKTENSRSTLDLFIDKRVKSLFRFEREIES